MRGWGCEVTTQAGDGPWRVPEHNPFGVFIRTPDVEAIAARGGRSDHLAKGVLRTMPRMGMYEVGINGPDGLLVRIGWPSDLMTSRG